MEDHKKSGSLRILYRRADFEGLEGAMLGLWIFDRMDLMLSTIIARDIQRKHTVSGKSGIIL